MNTASRVFVCGGDTLIGAALVHRLRTDGFRNLVGVGADEPDPTDAAEVERFFAAERPEFVFVAAGRSGGIGLNRERPADLMLDNLRVAVNVIPAAHRHGVAKLQYLASSCAYPRDAKQPLAVESLTTGSMEPTSEAYATAKLAGWKLCDAFRRQHGCRFVTGFPANAFGPDDDFSEAGGHVIPALIRRAHEAKLTGHAELVVWGTGNPRREFIYADDLADACVFAMKHYDGDSPINLGAGTDLSIAELADAVCEVVGFRGRLAFDRTKPDGAPLKRLDSGPLLAMGWTPRTPFRDAMAKTYEWFRQSSHSRLSSPSPLAGEGGCEPASNRVRSEPLATPHPVRSAPHPEPPSPARGEGKKIGTR